jgi:acetyl-CoA carboxylase biotin carboxyl carrier protein
VAPRDRETVSAKSETSEWGDLQDVRQLIDLIIEKGVTELELERAGVRVRIVRDQAGRPAQIAPQAAQVHAGPGAAPASPRAAAPPTPASPARPPKPAERPADSRREESSAGEEIHVVRSPMVGTFYSAANQGAEPFVKVGDSIQSGQVLCIIEAMKLMNEIESDVAGEVLKCYAENGQPVEYGEPLFDLRPVASGKKR